MIRRAGWADHVQHVDHTAYGGVLLACRAVLGLSPAGWSCPPMAGCRWDLLPTGNHPHLMNFVNPVEANMPTDTAQESLTLPAQITEAHPESRLGRLYRSWIRMQQDAEPRMATFNGMSARLSECRALLENATPDADMVALAAASAEITILERTLALKRSHLHALQSDVQQSREAWMAAWSAFLTRRDDLAHATRVKDRPAEEAAREALLALVTPDA